MTSTARGSSTGTADRPPRRWTGIAERALIEAIEAELAQAPDAERVIVGPGDDASVVRARERCVTSVDAAVQDVHFRLGGAGSTPGQVGRRALAGGLSDLAAMGADAGEVHLVLGLPAGFAERDAIELVRGARDAAGEAGASIVGGDIVGAGQLFVSVTVTGWLDAGERLARRDGARPGDLLGVSGRLGGAAARLAVEEGRAAPEAGAPAFEPVPRLAEGRALAGAGVGAMIDVSDGLGVDAAHLARASGVRIEIDVRALPLHPQAEQIAAQLDIEPWRLAAEGGEDYELLVCVSEGLRDEAERAVAQAGRTSLTWIGRVHDGDAEVVFSDGGRELQGVGGFEHRW
jgi:thiamine-monophosphate kinase